MCFQIFQNEKTPFQAIKTRSSKSGKIAIFAKGLVMVLVQNWPLFHFFFQARKTRTRLFTIFQNEKTRFQAIKARSSKSGKIAIFPRLAHGFSQKLAIFHLFFQGNIGRENVFYDILERKNAFLGYKNKMFKKWRNCHFSKGVSPWFWSKSDHFSIFFFWQYRPGKCVLRYSRTKKLVSKL